jgi:hypothetical protein
MTDETRRKAPADSQEDAQAEALAQWEQNGAAAIRRVRETRPDAYLAMIARLVRDVD